MGCSDSDHNKNLGDCFGFVRVYFIASSTPLYVKATSTYTLVSATPKRHKTKRADRLFSLLVVLSGYS